MKNIQIVSLFLASATFFRVTGTQNSVNKQSDDLLNQEKISFLEKTVFDLIKANKDMENTVKDMENTVFGLVKANKDVEDDLNHLKQLSKLNTVRTCEEMKEYGVDESGKAMHIRLID